MFKFMMKTLSLILLVTNFHIHIQAAGQNDKLYISANNKTVLEVCESLAKQHKCGLLVHPDALDAMDKHLTLQAKGLTWAEVQAYFADNYVLTLKIEDDYLEVSDAESQSITRGRIEIYNLSLIDSPLSHYPSPRLGIPEVGSEGGDLICEIAGESLADGLDGFVDLLSFFVDEDSYETSERGGFLYILASDATHKKIGSILKQVERNTLRQIHCRLYDVTALKNEKIILSKAEWESLKAQNCIGNFTLPDTVRNHFYIGARHAYISDMDVVGDGYDPVISVVSTGLVIDVTGAMTADGVTLVLQTFEVSDPEFTKRVAKNGNDEEITTYEKATVEIATIQDSRFVPYGGATIIRMGSKIYALECEGSLPQSIQFVNEVE